MNEKHIALIATELKVTVKQVQATTKLLDDGATVPFISRYRKEATGGLDEVAVTAIRDRLTQLRELDKRREAILKSLDEQDKLTDDLKEQVLAADTMAILEDIYLPYRPKRRTRATMAKEKGLGPLAQQLFAQKDMDPVSEAAAFIGEEKGVESAEDALAGARDIIAEWVNEHAEARAKMRELFANSGVIRSKLITKNKDGAEKYKDYFEWEEPIAAAPSHRILAMRRGEKEEFLSLKIAPPEEEALRLLEKLFVTGSNAASEHVRTAIHDSYKRLLSISMETETRLLSKQRADDEAIRVFSENLRQLLLSPPLGQKSVMAIDPGFRTGCKIVCLDRQGKLLHNDVIYPHAPQNRSAEAKDKLKALCRQFEIEVIAVGNGTAGRESVALAEALDLSPKIPVVMANESGASVYSASKVAREEFPEHDLTVRGAVSIGRRLTDPLAELVKIDPKSIGVGQYQHDVDQTALKDSLDDTVISCVNRVGVEVNTASKQLLAYVSGLGPQLAGNIVAYRNERGPFRSRAELKEVPRLGPKAFEQAAGFLRIRDGKNPLDASAVHPESYAIVEAMTQSLDCSVGNLMHDAELRRRIDPAKYVTDTVGLPTLNDIMDELAKPGRDPREKFEAFSFAEGINKMGDLQPGMKLPGIVTNITAFGAFVDIGIHQDGLIHISQLSDNYVKSPADVVKVQQKLMVRILEVDLNRKRIALSMKSEEAPARKPAPKASPSPRPKKPPRPPKPPTKTEPPKKPFNNPFVDFFKNREAEG